MRKSTTVLSTPTSPARPAFSGSRLIFAACALLALAIAADLVRASVFAWRALAQHDSVRIESVALRLITTSVQMLLRWLRQIESTVNHTSWNASSAIILTAVWGAVVLWIIRMRRL